MIRAMLLVVGVCLFGLVVVIHRQPLAYPYWVYYVEVDLSNNHSILYRVAPDDSPPEKLLERDSIISIRDIHPQKDSLLLSFIDLNTRLYELYRIKTNGHLLQRLLLLPGEHPEAVQYTEDGQWIIYEVSSEIRRMRHNGSENTSLIVAPYDQWAIQGDWVVVRQGLSDQEGLLWRIRIDGSDSLAMFSAKGDRNPKISSSGQWIVLTTEKGLYLLDLKKQTSREVPEGNGMMDVSFSEDSQWLLFTIYGWDEGPYRELKILNLNDFTLASTSAKNFSHVEISSFLPATEWFPVMLGDYWNLDIYRMNYDGSKLIPLFTEGSNDFVRAISPDNQWLIVNAVREEREDLNLVNSDGTSKIRLTNTPLNENTPFFVPNIDLSWHVKILAGGAILVLLGAGWSIWRRWRS